VITLKEIAQKANVSIGTVDRVVHNRGRVSKKTADRIRKIIKENEYETNVFARNLSVSKRTIFSVLMPLTNQNSGYWDHVKKGILKAKDELQHYKVDVECFHFDRYATESFIAKCEEIKRCNVDGILLAPILSDASKEFIKGINENVPYHYFDATIPGTNPIGFIGQDSFGSGVLAAKLMHLLTAGKGQIAIIRPVTTDYYHINERKAGFESYFQKTKNVSINNYVLPGEENYKTYKQVMKQLFEEMPAIQGIFVTNSSVHYAAEYIQKKKIKQKIHVIGYDLIEPIIPFLETGGIDFIIGQRPELQGYEGIYDLYRYVVVKRKVAKNTVIPLDIITKENYRGFLIP